MKSMIFALAFLMVGTASASVTSVKVCNPNNGGEAALVVVKGDVLSVTSEGKKPHSEKVLEVLEASESDLKEMASFYGLEGSLVSATSYIFAESGVVLAVDSKGIQYFLTAMGVGGTSKSCK
ncbi:hypothetical protein [Bdellovibrio sp. GT3]|uniref:hypothetical protein n=1 Tax=Bdellovibrio sp. GT3 TaxID=3136282 RepID=UPI0030F22718